MTEAEKPALPDLTDKQRAFVEAYLVCGFNATEAARRAGYSGNDDTLRSIGCENLTKPNIRACIDTRFKESAMTADEVLGRLADIARGSLEEFFEVGPRGATKLNLARAKKAGKFYLLKKYSKGKNGTSIEIHDPVNALIQIGKHLGMFAERNLNLDLSKLTDEQLQRIANGEDPLLVAATGASPAGTEEPVE